MKNEQKSKMKKRVNEIFKEERRNKEGRKKAVKRNTKERKTEQIKEGKRRKNDKDCKNAEKE